MTEEYQFISSDEEGPQIYTYCDNDIMSDSSEDQMVIELEETEKLQNDDFPPKFKGYDLCDFAEKVIVGNFKLPHSSAPEMFSFLEKKTAGSIFLTLEGTEKDEHLHFAIANSKITPDTLKSYIRKTYPKLTNSQKGGDKKYMAKYAKTLPYQVLYIFKERNENYFTNIDEVNLDKSTHMCHYADQYDKMHTTFSKTPSGQFYDYFLKKGGIKIGKGLGEIDPEAEHFYPEYRGPSLIRDAIAKIALDYLLEADHPNPGFQVVLKYVNYTHARLHKETYLEYLQNKLCKDLQLH